MSGGGRYWLLVALALAAVGSARAQGRAVEGTDYAHLRPPARAVIEPYANAGYQLRPSANGDGVEVFVDNSFLGSQSAFRVPPMTASDDAVFGLASRLVADADWHYEAVSRVLTWVAANVRYEFDRTADQEVEAVLSRRSAYCTGMAKLTVAMLQSVGIEAREVVGFVFSTSRRDLNGYHRWIEVYYPDVGWAFSDPLTSHHFVPASYVRFADSKLDMNQPHAVALLERRNLLRATDLYPRSPRHVQARRNSERMLAASLHVSVANAARGRASLIGNGSRVQGTLDAGEITFLGLEPGPFSLEVELDDGRFIERQIELRQRLRTEVFLRPPPSSGRRTLGSRSAVATTCGY